jgi:hypothetical protein
MVANAVLSLALASIAVPPGAPVANHAHPGHYTQPTLRAFERQPVDDFRQSQWHAFCQKLDELWLTYRAAGSTPQAWQTYKQAVAQLRRQYVYDDPYLAPVERGWMGAGSGRGSASCGCDGGCGASCGCGH